ncbi:hypothetical protein ANN_08393 [Periplaneta americana]|uniref:Uncharacterized protein n=1 Tax=Periplaneta americana TaxID=6978 RepID=A0ABQ8T2G4_PERAM|nr:hypothetical protein ANN_08393 [Periplaneta americana]
MEGSGDVEKGAAAMQTRGCARICFWGMCYARPIRGVIITKEHPHLIQHRDMCNGTRISSVVRASLRFREQQSEEYPYVLAIEDEAAVSQDEKGFSNLSEEVELALRDMKNGKAIGVDGIPTELVKCIGKDKKEILSLDLCNEIHYMRKTNG